MLTVLVIRMLIQCGMGWFRYTKRKEEEQANQFEEMKSITTQFDPDLKVSWNFPTEPIEFRVRLCLLAIGVCIGCIVLISMLLLITIPANHDWTTGGICPADHQDFTSLAQKNDLDCCNWHESTTCCHRSVCSNKPNAPTAGSETCNNLLGLLNCAPCRNDSGIFMQLKNSTSHAWINASIVVCVNFCEQLFNSCLTSMIPGVHTCAFGSTCMFSINGFVNHYNNTMTDKIQFCRDFGLEVDENNCFSDATTFSEFQAILLSFFMIILLL